MGDLKLCIIPGSFDPVTNGHLDVIRRGASLFDRVVVVVAVNLEKRCLFTAEERVAFLQTALRGLDHTEVVFWDGLMADYAKRRGACALVKGVRGGSDFDYESAMAAANCDLSGIETIFLPARGSLTYVSATLVRQIAKLGGRTDHLVPPCVQRALEDKFCKKN